MFQLALQICTLACVSIAIDGHVMVAINVEDFRYIANKYLSSDLVDKLTQLVSDVSQAKTINSEERAGKKTRESGLDTLADDLKDKLKDEMQEPEEVTPNYIPKRFNTVNNVYDEKFLKQLVSKTTTGPIYVKDEIEYLLNKNQEHSNNGNRKKYYATSRLTKRDKNIDPQEAIRPVISEGIAHEKIDYTETKLGEWRYNHETPKEPVKLKNIKTGNVGTDKYVEPNTGYDEFEKDELSGEAGNAKQVQYVYETNLLRNDIENHKDFSNIFEKQILEPKHKNEHEGVRIKQDTELMRDFEEDTRTENWLKKIFQVKNKEAEKPVRFEKHFLGSIEKEIEQIQPVEENEMYEKHPLGSSIETNTKKGVSHRLKENNEENIRVVKQFIKKDGSENEGDQSSNKEVLLLRNKKPYLGFKGSKNRIENKKGQLTGLSSHSFKYSDEEKSNAGSKKVKDQRDDKQATFTKKKDVDTSKSYKKPMKENNMNEKFPLVSDNEKSHKRIAKQHVKASNEFKQRNTRSTIKFNYKLTDKDSKSSSQESSLLKSTKRHSSKKVSKYCVENPDSEQCVTDETTAKSALKDSYDVSLPKIKKVKLGSEKGRFSDHESKNQKVNRDEYHLQPKKKDNAQKKTQKIIEENDMYEKYELGRDDEDDQDRIDRKRKNDHEATKTDHKNNFNRDIARHKDIQSDKNEETDNLHINKKYYNYKQVTKEYKKSKNDQNISKNIRRPRKGYENDPKLDSEEVKSKSIKKELKNDQTKSKNKKRPREGYADDPQPDFEEVKPESIKAKTESLLSDLEVKGKVRTKKFTMKGTVVPKRSFYKLSSPDYYKDLPREVDKYDFNEPLPEKDRERDRVKYLKREPARVNRKVKLPKYEKTQLEF